MSSKNHYYIQCVISRKSKNPFFNAPIKIFANPEANLVPMAVPNFCQTLYLQIQKKNSKTNLANETKLSTGISS